MIQKKIKGNSPKLTDKEFFEKIENIENPQYNLDYTHTFKKSVKANYKSNKDLELLLTAVTILVQTGTLPDEYYPHPLTGFKQKKDEKVMECHIESDWLLVWIQNNNALTLMLFETGSHSNLFYNKTLKKGKLK